MREVNSKTFMDAAMALEQISNNINEYINNILNDVEKMSSINNKGLISSLRLKKSCNHMQSVGAYINDMGSISNDLGNAYSASAKQM